MAIITFLSDFGIKDHYVATVKAKILSQNPSQTIIDISHEIRRHSILHAAFVMRHIYKSFPTGSVHIVAVDSIEHESNELVALQIEDHFFVGHNSGIFSLISSSIPQNSAVLADNQSTFPAKEIFADVAVNLAQGKSLSFIGKPSENIIQKRDRQLKITKREIVGQVIYTDHYGNLITNIRRSDFEKIVEANGGNPNYQIRFSRESFSNFHNFYTDVKEADCFVLFNSYGFLEIGINKGHAADLLGLRHDDLVTIEFTQ